VRNMYPTPGWLMTLMPLALASLWRSRPMYTWS
jgi:hypothetical protein